MPASRIALLVFVTTVLSLVLFSAIVAVLVFLFRKPLRSYKPVDIAIHRALEKWVTPGNNRLMLFITFLGRHEFLIPANLVLIGWLILVRHQNWLSVRVLTIALSSLVLMLLLKALFKRKRPLSPLLNAAKGLSFPSGHAIMAVTFYGLLIYLAWLQGHAGWLPFILAVLLCFLIIMIGLSRVYLRVHYASDVLAGFIIGFFWLWTSLVVLNRVEQWVISKQAVVSSIPA